MPRTKIPDIMRVIQATAKKYELLIGNVFHAGDGNIHPCIAYDDRDEDQTRRTVEASNEILQACVNLGGSITGEHGIGYEKVDLMPLIFEKQDIQAMEMVKDIFDANHLSNPGKMFPINRSCIGCGTVELKYTNRKAALL